MPRSYHVAASMVRASASRLLAPALLLLAASGLATPARAQLFDQVRDPSINGAGTDPGVTVLSRLRPQYDELGVNLGPVTLHGQVDSATGYDDNVLGTTVGRGSILQQTQVNLNAATNWSRNSVTASLQAVDNRFFQQPQQSYTNWNAALGGIYDVGRDQITVNYYHQNLNQTPRDLNTAQLDSAIAYRIDTVDLGYNAVFNRLSLRPELQVSNYDFDDGRANGQAYLQGYRNRVVATPQATASYEFSPQRDAVVVVRNAIASYRAPEAGQFVRDYNDTTFLAGLDYQLAGPYRFRILAGYETRSFTSRQFKTIQAPVAELSVTWTPTGLTTVTGLLSRRIADSADETTAGLTATTAKLSVDHELLRNVLLHGELSLDNDSYGQGGGSQSLYGLGAGVTWLLNRHLRLGATYAFTSRVGETSGNFGGSTASGITGQPVGSNYNDNRFLVQLHLGL